MPPLLHPAAPPQVYDERCRGDGSGITHFVAGTAGHVLSSVENTQKDVIEEVVSDWGFARFDVAGDGSSMRVRFILTQDGSVADEVTLRPHVRRRDACDDRAKAVAAGGVAVGGGEGGEDEEEAGGARLSVGPRDKGHGRKGQHKGDGDRRR